MENGGQARAHDTSVIPSYSVHLDAARTLAALVVFLGHGTFLFLGTTVNEQVNEHLNRASSAITPHNSAVHTHMGHQAVIVFFVLSGYLVGGGAIRAVRSRKWSTKSYSLQRLTRLWVVLIPALILGALLDTVGSHVFTNPSPIYANLRSVTFGSAGNAMPAHLSLVTFVGNVFFLQGILVPSFGTNGPLWSLSYEFWYYIMFPLLLAVFMSSAPMFRRACAVAALIAISVFCGKDISLYFLIWLLGALTYCLPLGISHTLARWITPFVCVLFAAFNVYAVVSPYNIVASDFTTGIFFSALLWLLLHFRQPARESLYRDAAKRLSAMSYTLYTVQYPIVEFFSAWLITNWSSRHLSLSSLGALLATYAATFSIAYLLYRCFEANTGRIRLVLAGYLVLR